MRVIQPSFEILSEIDGEKILKNIERAGRTCYKSEDLITPDSARRFIKMIIERGHESVLEHEKITIKFINDRGISHEETRHRLASFSMESTRFCAYSKAKFGNEISVIDIKPFLINPEKSFDIWFNHMVASEVAYMGMITAGESPQIARSVLPNSLKTEIVITANLREWRLIFKQRTAKSAHPQMRQLMCPLLDKLKSLIPVVFDDIILGEEK